MLGTWLSPGALGTVGAGLGGGVAATAATAPDGGLPLPVAALLGLVEGLTEFVPVSSTGHLILVSRALGLAGPAVDTFSVVIQLGALLAAVVYYRRTLYRTVTGAARREARALGLLRNLVLGSLPLLGLGYLFGKAIKARLFTPVNVAAALLFGGVVMVALDLWQRRRGEPDADADVPDAASLPPGRALLVGIVHTAALWPGTSRSMASLVGAQLAGLRTAAAADFAFLLALPTLGAATLYELIKEGPMLLRELGAAQLAVGLGVSFVVGLIVITGFLRFLRRYGLLPFGVYRIVVGLVLLKLM